MATAMVYQWREGFRAPAVPVQAAGERLAALRRQARGELTPGAVVADARPADAVLHPCFEWNDVTAASRYRIEQARALMESIVVVTPESEQGQRVASAVVRSRRAPGSDLAGVRAYDAAEEALRELRAWRRRYRDVDALEPVLAAIDAVLERLPQLELAAR